MRNGIQLFFVIALVATVVASAPTHTRSAFAATTVVNCKCGKTHCDRCGPRISRRRRTRCKKCPKCQTDICQLSAECVQEKKICFEVEQKLICIPEISLPWRKCEQPCNGGCAGRCRKKCGKSKTIKVLKTKVYECPTCKYTWKVIEPPLPNTADKTNSEGQPQIELELPSDDNVQQPKFEQDDLYDPSGDDIPEPPVMNRNNG